MIIVLLLFTYTGISQNVKKKKYTASLDTIWSSHLYPLEISPNGKWFTYTEVFNASESWLTLRNISNNYSTILKNCSMYEFSNNNKWFVGINDTQELILVDLVKHKKDVYPNILKQMFGFAKSGDYLVAYQKNKDEIIGIILINLKSKSIKSIPGVTNFQWHPTKDQLLLSLKADEKTNVSIYDALSDSYIYLTESRQSDYKFLNWSETGRAVFVEKKGDKHLLHFLNSEGKLFELNETDIATLGAGYGISSRKACISKDGERILFYREKLKKQTEALNANVEKWDTDHPWIYPRMKDYWETELQYALTAWYPNNRTLVAIETEQTPSSALNINHEYALVYNKLDYEPQYKYSPNSDLYVKNMKTGKTKLVTKNQYTEGKFITISPYGNYISYFKQNDWWVYDIKNDKTVNLTSKILRNFENFELERPGDQHPYGNPGWLGKDEHILLYDQHDIWMMTPDGKERKKITSGKDCNIRYRICKNPTDNVFSEYIINQNFKSIPYQIKNGVLLEIFDNSDYKTGYALWQNENPIETLLLENIKVHNVLTTKNMSSLIYCKESYKIPKGLFRLNLKTKEEILIYQSNEKLLDYDLGDAKLIEYKSPSGKYLKGALVYPANFEPDKSYPMIVQIYERESKKILDFNPPSDFVINGFNLLRYITNGYFVFYPDITFVIGDPGISALKSLTVAINKVLENGYIDKERIGLIGHSFGGYETAFIITQTDMFAVAVAGAAITEPISYYHDISWDFKQNQMWRMENQQLRIGNSFYDNKKAFYRNSPLQHIEKVNTPLLLWSGKLDNNVNWIQSVNMFMGLKRLQKKSKMLLFDNELHFIKNNQNQQFLSQEIYNWMEKYLKNP